MMGSIVRLINSFAFSISEKAPLRRRKPRRPWTNDSLCNVPIHFIIQALILKSSSQQLCPSDSYEIQHVKLNKKKVRVSLPVHSFNITVEVGNKNGRRI